MADDPRPQRPSAPRRGAPRSGAPRAGAPRGGAARGASPQGPREPRAEFVPAKKKGAPPALTIGLIGLIVVSAGVFGWAWMRKQNIEAQPAKVVETDNNAQWTRIKGKMREAEKLYREATALNRDEERFAEFEAKVDEAMDFIGSVLEEFDLMLEEVRDPETGDLPPEYNGYNHEIKPMIVWLEDLNKISTFGLGGDEDD